MEYPSESSSPALVSESSIRYLQWKIQSKIEDIEKYVSESNQIQTWNLCKIVKEQILDYEDEPQLSKTQNNSRRIYIASELIFGICSVHDNFVDFAFTKIINDLLHLDKYKTMSSKLTYKTSSNMKKEKYFMKEAHAKLLESLREEKEEPKKDDPALEKKAETEEELEISHPNVHHTINIQKPISLDNPQQILQEDLLTDSHLFNLMGDTTEVRIEPQAEASSLNIPTGTVPNDFILQPSEISIREPLVEQLVEEDINRILHNGGKITQPDIRISGLSEDLLLSLGNTPDIEDLQIEKLSSPTKSMGSQIHPEEVTEEWSLSTLEPLEISKKKCLKLRTDKLTVIPNYSIRAVQLNKNIEIQRVQVFEGSPRILQSMSSEYLMKTSGFKRFLSQNVRSSMINRLYNRNLTTEKRPVESFVAPKIQKRPVESKISERESELQERMRMSQGLIEVKEKVGLRSKAAESGVLAELLNEKTHRSISVNEPLEGNRLMALALSGMESAAIHPPDQEKIDNATPIPSPRIQQLQGRKLEPKKDSPIWFFSTYEKPPRAEFREFNYVRNKLHNYWSLFESQGMEKSITMREFLLFEEDINFANYLTLLRVVDKLSIQRELFLDYKSGEILIKPFETPYISKGQILLQGKEQIM